MPIGCGIPLLRGDAVHDAAENLTALGKDSVEPTSIGGSLDLPRVVSADRGERGAAVERGLGQVERAEVLELPRVEVFLPEARDEHGAPVLRPDGPGCGWYRRRRSRAGAAPTPRCRRRRARAPFASRAHGSRRVSSRALSSARGRPATGT